MDAKSSITVTSIQKLCIHDGNGLRTTVFLKGCFLCCPWCCNPETISTHKSYFYNPEKCLHRQQIESVFCINCEIKGGKCPKEECKIGAYKPTSQSYTTDELLQILLKDKYLYEESNGGVTFSGGEPFLQTSNIKELLQCLKQKSINIAFETSLFCSHNSLCSLLPYIDTFLIDLKLQFGFIINKELNNDYNNDFFKNIRLLQKQPNKHIVYRYVFIPESLKNEKRKKEFITNLSALNINKLEILPYHNLAKKKYEQLNNKFYQYSLPTPNDFLELTSLLTKHNIAYKIQEF